MGYGPVVNGKHKPITPWLGSWAQQMATPASKPAKQSQWPIGHPPKGPK